jgi:hypothetical protein
LEVLPAKSPDQKYLQENSANQLKIAGWQHLTKIEYLEK